MKKRAIDLQPGDTIQFSNVILTVERASEFRGYSISMTQIAATGGTSCLVPSDYEYEVIE